MTRRYGWLKDAPDSRDLMLAPAPTHDLPENIDLRPTCPPVYDQGDLGSCTGNATAGAVQFERIKQNLTDALRIPSRLFIYYGERLIEHTISEDAGAQIRDGIKVLAKHGTCFEGSGPADWAYDTAKFTTKPPAACFAAALKDRVIQYKRVVQSEGQIKACLAAGYPVVFGFTVYESFESPGVAKSGQMPMPHPGENVLGGHAVLCVGYDDAAQSFIVRNSWGSGWGDSGYFHMPYRFLTDPSQASDFWTIRLVSDDDGA
ncbi:MAG TPA: C1 family peptidase [Rhizomicrobium sp.]|jgi:C1A family cysteine protease|nr:C1 family peptidase [Rhizomicrobium sp.]